MITLDLDLSYLCANYNIAASSLSLYKNKSITQIMQTEAEKGNQKAAQFMLKVLSEPDELVKLFQLFNPKNRFLILINMNEDDLMKVMEYLQTDEFILGLSILNQKALVDLMMFLKPESLATVVLEKMDCNKFLKEIPEKFLDEFLESDKLDRNLIMKAMEDVDEEQLQKMMENWTGKSNYEESDSILERLSSLSDDDFMRAVFSFEPKGKQQLISNVIKEKPELFEEFSAEAMVHPFTTMKKEDILKSLKVLEPEEFLPMMNELPQEVMALVATQINPRIFSQVLIRDFASVITQCGINFG